MTIIYNLSKLDSSIQNEILSNPKYVKWFSEFPNKLLAIENDAKTIKGKKLNITTGIQYFVPYKISGQNVCSMAGVANCSDGCLNTAGRGAMGSVQLARLRKTLFFQQYFKEYKKLLQKEIKRLVTKSKNKNTIPAIRLNGTSDIRWELLIWDIMVKSHYEYGVKWYDYTKISNRIIKDKQVYDLTFSYSGVKEYQSFVKKALDNKMKMAVVFRNKSNIPSEFMNIKTYDGDETDARFLDKPSSIIALYAKGKAVKDTSGFVVD